MIDLEGKGGLLPQQHLICVQLSLLCIVAHQYTAVLWLKRQSSRRSSFLFALSLSLLRYLTSPSPSPPPLNLPKPHPHPNLSQTSLQKLPLSINAPSKIIPEIPHLLESIIIQQIQPLAIQKDVVGYGSRSLDYVAPARNARGG